jgi:hypothetical protein
LEVAAAREVAVPGFYVDVASAVYLAAYAGGHAFVTLDAAALEANEFLGEALVLFALEALFLVVDVFYGALAVCYGDVVGAEADACLSVKAAAFYCECVLGLDMLSPPWNSVSCRLQAVRREDGAEKRRGRRAT